MQNSLKRPSKPKYDEILTMKALLFKGKKKVLVDEVPVPLVTDPTDVVVKVTASTICDSDLYLYHNLIPGIKDRDIVGHESVGIVYEVGSEVKNFEKGDRVVISAVISCGQCDYCKRREWSCCDTTNPKEKQAQMYGHHTAALFGYSHTLGGYDGCQAEYVRVPFADVNLFPIPNNITDEQAVLVADVLCTSYHGTELSDIKQGDRVVVFGCGPVGLLTQMWAKYRGASVVVAIDVDRQRLDFAKQNFGSLIVDSGEDDALEEVRQLIPGGPDKIIDCVGFRFPDNFFHKAAMKLGVEQDSSNIVNLAIEMVRKNGRITLIGDYVGYTNHFNIGALIEKHLTINGGQLWPHNYHRLIFEAMSSGNIDPRVLLTHTYPMSKLEQAYDHFDNHEDGMIKALILPDEIYNKLMQGTEI